MLFPIGSKRTAILITYVALTIFCGVILLGWWHLLEPTIHTKIVAGAAAFLITALAVLSARQIGQFRAYAPDKRWYRGWKPYSLLAVISALGTLNAAFVLLESRPIVRSDVANVRSSYGALRNLAIAELPVKSYVDKLAQVNSLLKNLHEEIVNPNGGAYCGVGDSAKVIIAEIKQYIPSFHVLRGTAGAVSCDVAERVYQSYERMAHEMIHSDPDYLAARGPDKDALLATINTHWNQMRGPLDELEASATGLGTTDVLNMAALYSARSDYSADRESFISVSGKPWPALKPIKILQSERVNSYMATLRLLGERVSHGWSGLYVLFAFGIDAVVIYFITQVNVHYGRRKTSTGVAAPVDARYQSDPRYLWVQQPIS